jgi:hypothetical protein
VRWLADECIAASLVAYLRADGHDVLYVAEAAAGLSDADVIALASREIRLLPTGQGFRRSRLSPGTRDNRCRVDAHQP